MTSLEAKSRSLLAFLGRRSRLETVSLVAFLLVLVNQIAFWVFGKTLPFSGLLNFLFIVLIFILATVYLRRLIRRLLWRLRNRLIITYVFIGIVPIVLLLVMLGIAMYIFMGQVAAYLVTSELKQRNELVRDCAYGLAWNAVNHLPNRTDEAAAQQFLEVLRGRHPHLQGVVGIGDRTFVVPATAQSRAIPQWSRADFAGLLSAGPEYALAAHVRLNSPLNRVQAFAFEPADTNLLGRLLPGLASIQFLEFEKTSSGNRLTPQKKKNGQSVFQQVNDDSYPPEISSAASLPPSQAWWDILVSWATPVQVRTWEGEGRNVLTVVVVRSRPSLIISQLFSLSEEWASALKLALMAIGILFIAVEIPSLISGVAMTRTITRSIADLYQATLRIKVGDFSYRIPIRSKDQLSELADSFNSMTEDIQGLIRESKEKERLQSELEIAREVQSQLFPTRVPHLKTLELQGICNPARTVSGDYYDFVPIGAGWVALAIGDIAGKGISAALLMASIQASLRAQLSHGNDVVTSPSENFPISTSKLVALLNRQLYENTSPEKFASLYCSLYDDHTGKLVYTNAGHLPPILVRKGAATRLQVNGMVLGVLPDNQYGCDSINLEPGDLMVAFTDGITEPENEYGEQFGEDRLTELLVHNARKPLDELVAAVTHAVNEWSRCPEPQDDMTLLVARRI